MSSTYRVLIVDDEPPARDVLEVFVSRVPEFTLVASCANALHALEAMAHHQPHLVFLDIQMPQMTGLELMRLPLPSRPDIVLTTAYTQYALQGYDFSILDYLVKPIPFDRFMQSVAKFTQKQSALRESTAWSLSVELDPPVDRSSVDSEDSVWLREEKRLLQIPFEDVLYIEGLKDYVKVFLKDQMVMTHMSIGKAEELFRPPHFVRVHRSHIVRRSVIRLIDGNTIKLIDGTKLQIGPFYREELKKFISALR